MTEDARLIEETRLKRIRWRCRRGMLENDLILSRFLDASAASLTEDDVANLDRLLHMADDELWELLIGRTEVGDARLAPFVARLRAA
jgi:antitoxin CptB